MKQGTSATAEQLETLRKWGAKALSERARVDYRTTCKALAGEPVLPIYLQALLVAAGGK